MGWSVDVPFWASWIAVTVAGALSFVGFRAAMRSWQSPPGPICRRAAEFPTRAGIEPSCSTATAV